MELILSVNLAHNQHLLMEYPLYSVYMYKYIGLYK